MKKRITAMLIVLVMLLGMIPGTANAKTYKKITNIQCIKGLVDGKAVLGSTLSLDVEELAKSNGEFRNVNDNYMGYARTVSADPESESFQHHIGDIYNQIQWPVPDSYYLVGEAFLVRFEFDNGEGFETIPIPTAVGMSNIPIDPLPSKTYTGSPHTQDLSMIKHGEAEFDEGTDYTVSYKNNTNAGTASVIFTGKGNVVGSVTKTFKINKAANLMTVQNKTVKVKASKIKNKKQVIKCSKSMGICTAVGKLQFKLAKVNKKKFKKYFKVNAKNGNITIKKGLKKGTYKLKINVTAAGNANYLAATKQVVVTIKVK